MVADKSAENTQMPQRLAAQIVCPSLGIGRKIASWASVVRVREQENEVGLVFFFLPFFAQASVEYSVMSFLHT